MISVFKEQAGDSAQNALENSNTEGAARAEGLRSVSGAGALRGLGRGRGGVTVSG